MKKIETSTVTERLSLDRLKRQRMSGRAVNSVRREEATSRPTGQIAEGKDLIANLLTPEIDESAEFERRIRERGARRFAEWIEKELEK